MSTSGPEKGPLLQEIKTKWIGLLFDSELEEPARLKRAIHSAIKIALMVARDFIENLVQLQAMALAFKTLLSLAPLLAVIFSIFKAFGVHNRMEPALAEALAPLGERSQEITSHLIGFVDKMKAGALGSVGLATLFITVLSLMGTIEQAFNRIWRVRSPRKLARKFSDYLSVIMVGPVLVFAAVTITATLQSNTFVRNLIALEPFGTVILALLRLMPYVTLWGAFTFAYLFVPNTRVKIRSALVGGLVAALLWQTAGWGFTVFVASSTRYYAIYSSFAILLLFFIWLHIGWVIVLLGAQVAYAHQHVQLLYREERQTVVETPAGRERLALHLMFAVGRNFYHGFDPPSIAQLATELKVPAATVKDFMDMFQQARLVLALADEETFVLGRDPETIGIKEILDCVKNSGKKIGAQRHRTQAETEIDTLLLEVDQSVAEALDGKTLQSLIVESTPAQPRR